MSFLDRITVNPEVALAKGEVYPFVDMANVSTANRQPDTISKRMFTGSGARFQYGDTVIARIEPCLQNGKRFFCNSIEKGFGSTEYLVFRPKDHTVNPLFLYYFMQQSSVKQAMVNSMIGATGRQRVNNSVFVDIPFDPPKIETQTKIADILSAYDSLIETNQRQIKLLEEAAQRLYREWFVDLRFPGYEDVPVVDGVPEGWIVCTLNDVIEFNPRVSLAKDRIKQCVPMSALSTQSMILDSRVFTETASNSGSKFQNGDTLLARITPCLENGKTGFVSGLLSDEGAVGSTEFIVMRSKVLNPYMVYLLARTDDFRQNAINTMTGSDGRQRAQPDKIRTYQYLLPPREVIDHFERLCKSAFEAIYVLNQQNEGLAQARDRLLHRLMSGEIAA